MSDQWEPVPGPTKMDWSHQGALQATGHHTAGLQAPHTAAELPAPRWTPAAYDGDPFRLRSDFSALPPGGAGFGGPHGGAGLGGPPFPPPPYGFDPLVPPPPFGCPPPDPFTAIPAPVNVYDSVSTLQGFSTQYRTGPPRYRRESEPDFSQRRYEDHRGRPTPGGMGPSKLSAGPHAEDEGDLERRQDKQWLRGFLQRTGKTRNPESRQDQTQPISVPDLREGLYGAARLLSRLEEICHSLKQDLDEGGVWEDSIHTAFQVKRQLQDKLGLLSDSADRLKAKLSRLRQRRARGLRARRQLQLEAEQAEERSSEKEAAIDKWRMRRIQQVEEKKKDRELKAAADAVLCEVRRKQADVKRMQDVLKSLEKLRRLRKEAAARKGIVTEQQCDEAFACRLEQIRCVLRKRTALYSAEEKALMVMLEGEQEEERKRERERRVKKEWERQLQRRRRVDVMLFGEDLPAAGVLQAFREYYSQAEVSLQALLEIRTDWDVFLVAADHPDGSWVPQRWILPDAPSDQVWASALQAGDADSGVETTCQ